MYISTAQQQTHIIMMSSILKIFHMNNSTYESEHRFVRGIGDSHVIILVTVREVY